MLLSDRDIRAALTKGTISINPPPRHIDIQPASVDLHLGGAIRCYKPNARPIDPALGLDEDDTVVIPLDPDHGYTLTHLEFVLGTTYEHVSLPADIGARIEGKSTIGRFGTTAHVTAGFIDPGFSGQLTLEIVNFNPQRAIILRPGMRIAQLSFERMSSPVERMYGHRDLGSHYQYQRGPTAPGTLIRE